MPSRQVPSRFLYEEKITQNRFITYQGNQTFLYQQNKISLSQFHKRKNVKLQIQNYQNQIKESLRSVLVSFPGFLDKYSNNFQYLDSDEVDSGLLSLILSSTASQLMMNYLVFLIRILKYQQRNLQPRRCSHGYKNMVEFISFKISDLLRCKCTGTLEQIKKVYKKLLNHPKLKIYRIKNRTNTSNRDFLVNVKWNNAWDGIPMLCQIQLKIIQKEGDQKQKYVGHFSHLLYQLSRAKYGPIGEAVMINTHLTDFVPFFKQRIPKTDKESHNLLDLKVTFQQAQPYVKNYQLEKNNNISFICANCLSFREAYCGFLEDYKKKRQQNVLNESYVCGKCVFSQFTLVQKSNYLLRNSFWESRFFTMISDEEYDKPSFEMPFVICLQEKLAPILKPQIYQNAYYGKDSTFSFVPTFWRVKRQRQKIIERITKKQLKEKYYLFKLRDSVQIFTINRIEFLMEYENKKQAEQCWNQEKGKIQIHYGNQIPIHLQNPLLDAYSFNLSAIKPNNFHSYQNYVQEGSLSDRIPRFANDIRIKFATGIERQMIQSSACQKLMILFEPSCQHLLLFNDVTEIKQVQDYINNRKLQNSLIQEAKTILQWNFTGNYFSNQLFEVFKGYSLSVQFMYLSNNKFVKIPQLIADNLTRLWLSNNSILQVAISQSMFPRLEELSLSRNLIQRIIKLQHRNLKSLELDFNRIRDLNEKEWKVPQLASLDVSYNRITNIDLSAFSKYSKLNISDNPFEQVIFPSTQFSEVEELKINSVKARIDMSKASFAKLKDLQIQNHSHQEIILSDEMPSLEKVRIFTTPATLIRLPQTCQNLKQMIFVKWDKMQFFNSSNLPKSLPNLQIFQILGAPQAKSIDLSDISLPSLKKLRISGFPVLEEIILPKQMPNLQKLSIDCLNYKQINFIRSLPNLKQLQICYNEHLKVIDLHQANLSNLQIFRCLNRQLERVIWSKSMKKLKKLDLSQTQLTELDLTEISLDHLEELKCVKNKLILIKFPKGIVLPLLKVIELDEKFLKPEGFQIQISNITQLQSFKNVNQMVMFSRQKDQQK